MATPKTKRGTATEHADVQAERDQNHMEAAQADLVDDERMEELAGKLAVFFASFCCKHYVVQTGT